MLIPQPIAAGPHRPEIQPEGPRAKPEISFRDGFRFSRRPAVRLTQRAGGGFRLDGAPAGPIEGAPESGAVVVRGGGRTWSVRLRRTDGRTCTWAEIDDGSGDGAAVVTWEAGDAGAPASLLLADGRLFRIALAALDPPAFHVGRYDLTGAYLSASSERGAWRIEPTVAGQGIASLHEIVIATCYEIGRRSGWF